MADYSDFPFDAFTTAEVVQMFMKSIEIGNTEFTEACREEIRHRPELVEEDEEIVATVKGIDTGVTMW